MSGSLTMAELSARMPESGGIYVFLRNTYGELTGFLYGWAYFIVVNTGGLAALSIAFATYLGVFKPLSPLEIKIVAITGLIALTVVNSLGVKIGGIVADILTTLKIVAIFGVILVGFWKGSWATNNFAPVVPQNATSFLNGLALAMVGVLWSYGGWQHATYVGGEAREKGRHLPFALISGTLIVILIYLLTNLAYLRLLSVEGLAQTDRAAADAMGVAFGSEGARWIAVGIFISVFGTAGIYTMTAPRIYFAMANDGIFFKKVAYIHPRFRVPVYAIVFQTVWAIVLILSGTFYQLITYVAFTDWIFFALTGGSLFIIRRRHQKENSSFHTPGYPVVPLFFVIVSTWFVLNTLISSPVQSLAGLGFLILGVPVYYYWKKRQRR